MEQFIPYYRVSTQKQGSSGLGLEAQRHTVARYVQSVGGQALESFVEIETAGNKDRISVNMDLSIKKLLKKRPLLWKAIELAQQQSAVLIVKEASRLTRYSLLMDFLISSGIRFVCADSPNDSPMIIKLKTAINEEELLKISTRTKAALSAKRARGYQHQPSHRITREAGLLGIKVIQENARLNENNLKATEYIQLLRDNRSMTYQEIADTLNAKGFRTNRGKAFHRMQVKRLYQQEETGLISPK